MDATLAATACALSSPGEERRKNVWNLRVFGHRNELLFAAIRQRWLREAAKHWTADTPQTVGPPRPRHRASTELHPRCLSDSLQRAELGNHPTPLGRRDIEIFLNRLVASAEDVGRDVG
ncbi:hypothetical protein [Streptomyces bobili]|uniref:hypothetical protein n=1 Tax=Streptomyces bobili TaxID=67280 RepID=UPI0037FE77DD